MVSGILSNLYEILDKCEKTRIKTGDIILLLKLLKDEKVGRYRLTSELSVGEATVRTVLKHLKSLGYVKRCDKAHTLTDKGIKLINSILKNIKSEGEISTPYKLGKNEYYLHIGKSGGKVKSGLKQRDAALLCGGQGALTLVFSADKGLIFPDSGIKLRDVCPELDDEMMKNLSLSDDDVILIVGAESPEKAKSVAYSVLTTFLE